MVGLTASYTAFARETNPGQAVARFDWTASFAVPAAYVHMRYAQHDRKQDVCVRVKVAVTVLFLGIR